MRSRRSSSAALWLFLLLLALAERAAADALDVSAIGLANKVLWGKVSWIGSAAIAVLLLICVLEYVRLGSWLTPRRIAALFVVPALEVVAVFSNEWHHLVWTGFTFASFPEYGETSDEVLAAADQAVYLAKAQGRNRVV